MNTLEERKKNRWLMLRKFYELADGHSGRYIIDMWKVGEALGWDRKITAATYDYLQGEGLLEAVTLGGGATITHYGVKEVESAAEHPDQPTLHFPAFIVNITGTGDVNMGDHFEVGGSVIGAALGRGAKAKARDVTVYSESLNQSSFDDELKQALIKARESLDAANLSDADKNDVADDLQKLTDALEQEPVEANRIQRFWSRIKDVAPTAAAILATAASIAKLLHLGSENTGP